MIHILSPTNLLYEALGQPEVNGLINISEEKKCPLCGSTTEKIVKWKPTPTFTYLELFSDKENINFLCPACSFALGNIRGLHKAYILTLKKGFTALQFDDQADKKISFGKKEIVSRFYLRDFLLNPPTDDPWILMLQSSMNPQHWLLRAKVNYGFSDTLWVSDGKQSYAIPTAGLKELLNALEVVKRSNSLYPLLYKEGELRKDHKEISLWENIEPIISQHRFTHYLPFLYERVVPPKNYLLEYDSN